MFTTIIKLNKEGKTAVRKTLKIFFQLTHFVVFMKRHNYLNQFGFKSPKAFKRQFIVCNVLMYTLKIQAKSLFFSRLDTRNKSLLVC